MHTISTVTHTRKRSISYQPFVGCLMCVWAHVHIDHASIYTLHTIQFNDVASHAVVLLCCYHLQCMERGVLVCACSVFYLCEYSHTTSSPSYYQNAPDAFSMHILLLLSVLAHMRWFVMYVYITLLVRVYVYRLFYMVSSRCYNPAC